jgi:small subunit ribosomal protein S20
MDRFLIQPAKITSFEDCRVKPVQRRKRTVPNIKSAKKRLRQSNVRRDRNRAVRSELRTRIKTLLATEDAKEAAEQYRDVSSLLDRAARKGVIASNAADRRKSRLARFVSGLET